MTKPEQGFKRWSPLPDDWWGLQDFVFLFFLSFFFLFFFFFSLRIWSIISMEELIMLLFSYFVCFCVNGSLISARQRWKAWFTIRRRIQSKSSCCLCQQYTQSNHDLVWWLVRLLRSLISLWWNKIYNSFFLISIRWMRDCRMGRLCDSYVMIYTCGSPIFSDLGISRRAMPGSLRPLDRSQCSRHSNPDSCCHGMPLPPPYSFQPHFQ